jgi:hypothetical protein
MTNPTSESIHTCSYYCERPECIKRQRDEMRDAQTADARQEPDCWAILTPNGSKLVSPEEAKGNKRAYPLYAAPPAQEGKPHAALDRSAALAALREQGEAVLPRLPVLSESPVIVGQPGMLKLRIWAENYAKAYGLACYRAGNIANPFSAAER